MYKIRLYVVPEVQGEENDDEKNKNSKSMENNLEYEKLVELPPPPPLPPSIMQRKNSRRPNNQNNINNNNGNNNSNNNFHYLNKSSSLKKNDDHRNEKLIDNDKRKIINNNNNNNNCCSIIINNSKRDIIEVNNNNNNNHNNHNHNDEKTDFLHSYDLRVRNKNEDIEDYKKELVYYEDDVVYKPRKMIKNDYGNNKKNNNNNSNSNRHSIIPCASSSLSSLTPIHENPIIERIKVNEDYAKTSPPPPPPPPPHRSSSSSSFSSLTSSLSYKNNENIYKKSLMLLSSSSSIKINDTFINNEIIDGENSSENKNNNSNNNNNRVKIFNHNYQNNNDNKLCNDGIGRGEVKNHGGETMTSINNNNNNHSKGLIVPCGGNYNNSTVIFRRNNNKLNRYREYDLEQKIEVEIKMREGSARLLAAARHRAQSLEAARALLTSNERMSAYMAELQRRKKEPSSNKPSLPVSNARVSLSDLRIPLMWRDSDHFKNRGDYRRFAVFCLARVGTEIHDTALLCPVDRALTDVTFPDVLVFNNVPAEFEVTLEIYSHILQEDLSIASTPRRIKRSIHSSISRTVGKKLAASLRDELNSGKIGPHFELMASARLTLDDTDDNIHTHDLVLNNLENKNHSLPLFGHFCCRLAAQPECITKEACSGNIILDGRSCWARIQGFTLQAWGSRKLADDEQKPWSIVPINKETLIQPSKSSSKELRISNTIEGSDKITTIKLESSEEAQKWVRQLVAHAKDHLRWRHAAEIIQDVPSVESARNSFISNKRQGSLYDETPLIESVQSDFNTASRPTVQEIFGLTPSTSLSSCSSTSSPPSLRSRSLSTSGTRKSGTNTLRSHWPFSNKNHD